MEPRVSREHGTGGGPKNVPRGPCNSRGACRRGAEKHRRDVGNAAPKPEQQERPHGGAPGRPQDVRGGESHLEIGRHIRIVEPERRVCVRCSTTAAAGGAWECLRASHAWAAVATWRVACAVGDDIGGLLRMASPASFAISCSLRPRFSAISPLVAPPSFRVPYARLVACSIMPVQPHEVAAVAQAAAADAVAAAPGPPTIDIYAGISTIPISAALIGSGVDATELNGDVCSLTDRPNKKQVCLFYCDETEELARRIAAETDSVELKSIKWGTFADGFPNLFVPNAHGIRGQHVAFLASFSSPAVIFEQLSIIYALPRMFVSSFTLVLPFFPTGTLERMEDEGDIATAFTLARILSNIPISRGGPTSLVIFDIHALQERFYFGDNVLPCFESGIPLLKHRLHQLPDSNNITIAFPDEGAWKRFYKQLQHFPMVICTKVRDGNNRIVKLKEGDPTGRHVVIVDDLVQSGGTLIECQKLLATMGASKVSAYVTHGVFPKRSWERFIHDNGEGAAHGFAHFWLTDSCASTVKEVRGVEPFEVLSLAGSIAVALHI